jgi:hypothetical protein
LPHYLARYRFEYVDDNGKVVAEMPGVAPEPGARTTREDPRYFKENGTAADTTMGDETNGNGDANDQNGGYEENGMDGVQ